ncbi:MULTISPECIES: hypothetical protein [Alphaproteobacteria]|uniref:hypothetical protein n=1 Tax=Sphingopyxis sp. TaxID=1908224 RepID=UPI004034D033
MALAPGMTQRRGLFGASARIPQQQPAMTATEQPMKKGFDWGKLIGVIGDSLSIAGGGQAQFVPNLIDQRNRRQAQAYAEQTYQRRRGDELQDYGLKQEIEAKYRPAPSPYRWESNDGSLLELGPDGQPKIVYKDPTPKINWVRADNGDGTFTMVPMGPNGPINLGGHGGPSGTPAAPKGKLKPYGGQTATPSGNFR